MEPIEGKEIVGVQEDSNNYTKMSSFQEGYPIVAFCPEKLYVDRFKLIPSAKYVRFYMNDDRTEFDFKSINDNFSHEEGDNALVAFASILSETVSSEGIIIRFAGDEFIILMPKFKGSDISVYKDRINANLEKYNETSGKPYKLAAAIGGRIFDSRQDDMSDLVSQIDSLMYSDKKAYYMDHDRRGRKQHSKKAAE